MKKTLLILTSGAILLTSCGVPKNLMQPSEETLKIREAQSRTYETSSGRQLLQASVSALQDMGYTIKESSAEYGVLTAEKEASAISTGQVLGAIAMAVLTKEAKPIDETQHISATVVVLDKNNNGQATARTTFQRVITRTDKTQYAEIIKDQSVYREFFEKLDKSLFYEVNNI